MGSKTYEGVQFLVYVKDHGPRHLHGFYGEVEVIVDLLAGGKVRQSERWDAITPPNGKRSDSAYSTDGSGPCGRVERTLGEDPWNSILTT